MTPGLGDSCSHPVLGKKRVNWDNLWLCRALATSRSCYLGWFPGFLELGGIFWTIWDFFFVNFGFFWTIFGFSFYNCGIFLTIWEFFGTILGFSAATNEPWRRVRAGPAPAPLVLNKSSLIPQNHGIIEAEKILWEHQTQPPTIPARPRTDPNPEGHSLGVFGAGAPNRVWLFM